MSLFGWIRFSYKLKESYVYVEIFYGLELECWGRGGGV